jgi:hypothetical protein
MLHRRKPRPKEEEKLEETKEEEEAEEEDGGAVFDAISELYKKYVDKASPDEVLRTPSQFEQVMDEGVKKAREDALNDGRVFNGKDEEIAFALDWLNKTFADKAPKQEPAPAQAPGEAEKPVPKPGRERAKDKATDKVGGQPRARHDARAQAVKQQKQEKFIANRVKAGNSQAPEADRRRATRQGTRRERTGDATQVGGGDGTHQA